MNASYARFEFLRLFRNRQNFIFSLIFPVVMFFAIASAGRNQVVSGHVTVARFYMAGMIGFGTLAAVFAGGARIAMERQIGWNRQLRLTPLTQGSYLRTKVLTSYLLAIISVLLVTGSALALGVRFAASDWFQGVGLTLIALIPFAALGIMVGHLIRGDSMGPVIAGGMSLFVLIGGGYFPIGVNPGFMHDLVRLIPSFWLIQAGKTGIGGQSWNGEAWLVVLVWSVAGDTGREIVYSAAQIICVGRDDAEIARRAAAIGREVDELRENGLAGTPAQVLDRIGTFADAGITRMYLQALDLSDLDHLELVAAEVLPHV